MRLYLLDKLICPYCGHFPLAIEITDAFETVAPGVGKQPCALYCAHEANWLQNIDYDPPCASCLSTNVGSGELACGACLAHYPIKDGIPDLLMDTLAHDWVIAEQGWWDQRYLRVSKDIGHITSRPNLAGLRYYERAMYLFVPLKRRGVQGAALLEVGAGTAEYVARLLPPSAEQYFYVATDIAREALRIGAQIIPEGDFVQCEATRMPFRKESFDTVLCLGLLHHLPHWQPSLEQIIELLKPSGWLLLNEAIEKPNIFGGFLKKTLGTAIDSPHGGEIKFEALISILQRHGRLIAWSKKTTTLRVLLIWVFGWLLERSVLLTRLVLWLDELSLRSIGQVARRLGPAEVIGIFEKSHLGDQCGRSQGIRQNVRPE